MAPDTQSKKGSQDMQAEKMDLPKYEYQTDDSRSFSVTFECAGSRDKGRESHNSSNLKVF
ncbi:hypothetical protein ABIF26_007429 [Bradyrhizobium elkanii]